MPAQSCRCIYCILAGKATRVRASRRPLYDSPHRWHCFNAERQCLEHTVIHLWAQEVSTKLLAANFKTHTLDRMLFMRRLPKFSLRWRFLSLLPRRLWSGTTPQNVPVGRMDRCQNRHPIQRKGNQSWARRIWRMDPVAHATRIHQRPTTQTNFPE